MKMTPQEFEKAVEVCTGGSSTCHGCPLEFESDRCKVDLLEYVKENLINRGTVIESTEETAEMPEMICISRSELAEINDQFKLMHETLKYSQEIMSRREHHAFNLGEIAVLSTYGMTKLEMILSQKHGEDETTEE